MYRLLELANSEIEKLQSEIDRMRLKEFTPDEIWVEYSKAVGGKTYDGKPLPKFNDLGKQQVGWVAVAKLVNNQKKGE